MKRIIWVALLIAGPALGQVYKCNQGGGVIFTSTPCDTNAKPLDVRPASGQGRRPELPHAEAPQASAPGSPPAAKPLSLTERADQAARRRILDDEIWRKQQSINALTDEMTQRQTQLRNKKSWANNNLAGAVWEQSISDEMQAVAAEYDLKIRKASKELEDLKLKRAQLQ
jgi:multidrug resistance efflux pump